MSCTVKSKSFLFDNRHAPGAIGEDIERTHREMLKTLRALRHASRGRHDVSVLRRSLWIKRSDPRAFADSPSRFAAGPSHAEQRSCSIGSATSAAAGHGLCNLSLPLHTSAINRAASIIQFPLAQTGEGIKECELTEWYVKVLSQIHCALTK